MNLLNDVSPSAFSSHSLTWRPAPANWEALPGGGMRVSVPPQVDYFQDPRGVHIKDDAPFFWLPVRGDFVAQAHVRPTFTTTWDAAALMARFDARHWAKLCFESTDIGTHAVVSVVTNGTSDDANGANLSLPDVWLQIFRAGDVFGMHYALDGEHWQMVRIFRLDGAPEM